MQNLQMNLSLLFKWRSCGLLLCATTAQVAAAAQCSARIKTKGGFGRQAIKLNPETETSIFFHRVFGQYY